MTKCFFVSDLHGKTNRFEKLFSEIIREKPGLLFMGGDIYPNFYHSQFKYQGGFFNDFLIDFFRKLKKELGSLYPKVYIIMGNDDPRYDEVLFTEAEKKEKLWEYINNRKTYYGIYTIYGYSFIPPTPFQYKDWELYDVSRYVDPGCIHPMDGKRLVKPDIDIEYTTIKCQLEKLTNDENLEKAVFLFHSPPYKTALDRAALDGQFFDHVPLDVHVGSIAIKELIYEKSPFISLHGHIHESSRITGCWKEKINNTFAFNASIEGNSLSLIIFELEKPENAIRKIL